MDSILNDLRYAVRSLRRTPAFTIAAVLTLAIGIGANTAIYSLTQALIVRPIAIPEPHRVVQLGVQIFSYRNFHDALQRTSAYAGVAVVHPARIGVARENAGAIDAQALFVSPSYFAVLQIAPAVGRLLQDHDARDPGTSPVVLGPSIEALLYNVKLGDPSTMALAARALTCVALLASYVPIRRMLAQNPLASLWND